MATFFQKIYNAIIDTGYLDFLEFVDYNPPFVPYNMIARTQDPKLFYFYTKLDISKISITFHDRLELFPNPYRNTPGFHPVIKFVKTHDEFFKFIVTVDIDRMIANEKNFAPLSVGIEMNLNFLYSKKRLIDYYLELSDYEKLRFCLCTGTIILSFIYNRYIAPAETLYELLEGNDPSFPYVYNSNFENLTFFNIKNNYDFSILNFFFFN